MKFDKIPTIAVVYDRRGRGKHGTAQPVEVRVTIDRDNHFINTGVRVKRTEWDGQVINRMDAPSLNERISIIVRRIHGFVNRCIDEGKEIDFAEIKLVTVSDESPTSFIDFVLERMSARNVCKGTRSRYRVFLNCLERYGKLKRFKDLTTAAVMEFDAWLHTRDLTDATIYNYHKSLKLFIADAVLMGKMSEHPYSRLPRGYISRGEQRSTEYLTEDEMRRIERVELPTEVLERARDVFVFQMYTGLSFGDMELFNLADYEQQGGVYVYNGKRKKTGVEYTSVLLPAAVAVLRKYDGTLPLVNNADYNHQLKEIAAYAHVSK
ncbi:MAG: site-specific integrase, partial [Muribaculaceae bacterium]|nr:site-specific integrase [Muribaculaceae bacterium]